MNFSVLGIPAALLVSGCATGALVSAGPLSYTELNARLRCEVTKVFEQDQKSLQLFDVYEASRVSPYWAATIEIEQTGKFTSKSGLSLGISRFPVGTVPLTAKLGIGHESEDKGTVNIGRDPSTPFKSEACRSELIKLDRKIELGLVPWYKSIAIKAANGKDLVKKLVFRRELTINFPEAEISASYGFPALLQPSASASRSEKAIMTVTFELKPAIFDPKRNVVALDDASLAKLARLIKTGGKPRVSSAPKAKDKVRIAPAAPEADVPTLNERIELRRLQTLGEEIEKLVDQ